MAQCRWCGKSGLFLRLSNNGLCEKCSPFIIADIVRRGQIINESAELIKKSKKVDVISSRFDLVVEQMRHLYQYEQRNIPTIVPLPSAYFTSNKNSHDDYIVEGFERELNELKLQLLTIKTDKAKTSHIYKFLEKIEEYVPKIRNPTLLNDFRSKASQLFPSGKLIEGVFVDKGSSIVKEISAQEIELTKNQIIPFKHSAQNIFYSDKDSSLINVGPSISVSIKFIGDKAFFIKIPQDDPSTVFRKLNVSKPNNPDNVSKLDYFPSYAKISPQQRWKYLNWLEDINQKIDIGYVFIYYYGLERQLLTGNFESAFSEIKLLRDIHLHKSLISYSTTALLYSALFKREKQKLQEILGNRLTDIIKSDELLICLVLGYDLSPESLIRIAKGIKSINLRFYKSNPDLFIGILTDQIRKKYSSEYFPLYSRFVIKDIPKRNRVIFANYSFPENIRSLDVPDFLSYEPFLVDILEVFSKTHEIAKKTIKE